VPLTAKLLDYYREVVKAHADDPVSGACPVCHSSGCEDQRFARERLLCAGDQVDGHERWSDLVDTAEVEG
jgi:hypothetical protein